MARSATRRAPVRDRPPWLHSALGSGQSLACCCPLQCVWLRSPWCADLGPSEPCRSCTTLGWRPGCLHKVETMPDNLARGSLDRRDTAEAGQGSLATQPLGIVPGHDQQRRGVVGAYAWQRDQLRGDLRHQPVEVRLQLGDLLRESHVTASHRTERELGGRANLVGITSEAETCTASDEFLGGKLA